MNTNPSRDEISTRIQLLVAKLLNLPIDRVRPELRLQEDLGCDSVFMMHLALTLEDEFGVELDVTDNTCFATIDSTIDNVARQLGAN